LGSSIQASSAPNDWSALPLPPRAPGGKKSSPVALVADPANGGIRREPELPEHEDIAPEQAKPSTEFAFEDDAGDKAVRARVLRAQARGLARQASMDPNDGIDL
jgi:type IV secretion system protein VirD4